MKKSILYILIFVSLSYILNSQNIHFQLKTKLEGFMFKPDSLDIFFYSTGETVRLKGNDSINLNTLDVPNDNSINSKLSLKSNLVANSISFDLNSESDSKAKLNIYDISGNSVLTQEIILSSGINSKEIELPNINSGIYFLKITNGNQQYSAKFIKSDKKIGGANNPPIKQVPNIQSSEVIKVTAYLKTFIPQTFDNITIANDTNLVLVMSDRTLGKVKSISTNIQLLRVLILQKTYKALDGIIYDSTTKKDSIFKKNYNTSKMILIDYSKDSTINIQCNSGGTAYSCYNRIEFNLDGLKINYFNFCFIDSYGNNTPPTIQQNEEHLSWKLISKIPFLFNLNNQIQINFSGINILKNSQLDWVDFLHIRNYGGTYINNTDYTLILNDTSNCNFSMIIEFE